MHIFLHKALVSNVALQMKENQTIYFLVSRNYLQK